MRTMKSAVIRRWHSVDVLDVVIPELGENEVLMRVLYCGICGSDIHVYNGKHPTARLPVPMGHEMVGVVERIHSQLPLSFSLGDRVSIHGASCGRCDLCLSGAANQCLKRGVPTQTTAGAAQYMVGHVDYVVPIPPGISDVAAALLEPFACAVRTTERARIRPGDSVCVIGGGTIGLACGMLAKLHGASQVLLSARRPFQLELARKYGFVAIDARNEDVAARVRALTGGRGAEVTIEAACTAEAMRTTTQVTAVEGTIVMLAVGLDPMPQFDVGSIALREFTIVGSRAHTAADMRRAAGLMEALNSQYDIDAMVTDILPLEEIERGYQMMILKQNKGKILLKME